MLLSDRVSVNLELEEVCNLEWLKWRTFLCSTLLQILIKHLFPACGVHLRGGRENPIQIEQDGIIFTMRDGIIEKSLAYTGEASPRKIEFMVAEKNPKM